jgi:hypothetical protein
MLNLQDKMYLQEICKLIIESNISPEQKVECLSLVKRLTATSEINKKEEKDESKIYIH